MLDIEVDKTDKETKVVLSGMVDSTTADEFASKMEEVLTEKPGAMTLDFEKVDYISSAGFRILFMIAKEMTKNAGTLKARGVSDEIQNLFDMVHMDHVMTIEK